jgi:hypothetical protein
MWSSYKEGGHETQGEWVKKELDMSWFEGMDKRNGPDRSTLVTMKHWYPATKLHSVTTQNASILTITAMKTSKPIQFVYFFLWKL